MARYDRQYDFGLRGYRQTAEPMMNRRGPGYDAGYRGRYDERAYPRFNHRVTARYNLDYVTGDRGSRYGRDYVNPYMYTGDNPARVGDDRYWRAPYLTRGGTRTLRGSSFPTGYDYPDYGPNYGGRYPDEL